MKAKFFVSVLLIFTFFISCNNKADKSDLLTLDLKEPGFQKSDIKDKQQIPVGSLQQTTTDSGIIPMPLQAASNPDWDKKIIKTATLKLEVKDFKKYNDNVHKTAKQFGAYIAQEEQNLTDEKSETVISIKVPVAQFETMMNLLPGDDGKVMERKITTEDVTGEVVDTRSRLEAKKQMRIKYLEFLKQSKNMEEVLQVQNEINGIQEEIESATGRVEYLSHQSLYSTINLSFYQPINGYKPSDGAPSFFTRITAAFKTGAGWIADLFVGLVSVWPLVLIAFAIYFGWKKLRPAKVIAQKS
jgi:hypothetical protein